MKTGTHIGLRLVLQDILWLFLTLAGAGYQAAAQPATVTYPFAVGTTSTCGGSTAQMHYYTYNSGTNTITSITSGGAGAVNKYTPQLRIGLPANGTQRFSYSLASVSFNPRDKNIYYLWTAYPPSSLAYGGVPRTFVWRWPAGTQPTSTANKLDTLRSFAFDILGVAFDAEGSGYMLEFPPSFPFKPMLRSIDFTTGIIGGQDTLDLTGGAVIYASGSGDVAMSPSGQMFFVVDNKLFTPNYTSYTGTGQHLTCTYIDTVQVPSNNFVGLTYAEGETVAAFSGGGCPFREVDPMTGDTSVIIRSGTVYSASDLASIISGIGAAKRLVSATPTGTPEQYDVVYEIVVKNYGNTDVSNVQLTDNLAAINGASNVSMVTVSMMSNPAGLVLNPGFNGVSDLNLFNGIVTLPNYPVASSSVTLRISCRLSGIQNGLVYYNSAVVTGIGYNTQNLRDSSTNGNVPDLNDNDKPDDNGEGQPTPLLVSITGHTPPCALLTNVFYTQDFGTGTGLTSVVPVPIAGSGASSLAGTVLYAGSTTQPIPLESYTITNIAQQANTAHFLTMTDHTGNSNGRMLLVNADAANTIFYRGSFQAGLCANQQYSVSFYASFIGNTTYQTICDGFGGFRYPKIKVRVIDQVSGLVITELSTGDLISTNWQQLGIKFISPASYTGIIFELVNDAPGGCGNDLVIDDIQFGSCDPQPVVGLDHINAGCLGSSASFTAILSDPGAISGTPEYQWQISNDGISWSDISGAPNAATYTIAAVASADVNKYYRALVAGAGNLGNPDCRYSSPSFFLVAGCDIDDDDDGIPDTVESGGADPLDDDDGNHIMNYLDAGYPGFIDTNNDGVNDSFDWDLDGIINELDPDSDNDGIPDVTESGGVDSDGDGKIDGYTDVDYDGFSQNVDANTTGKDLSGNGLGLPDLDADGIPNQFDLDSDNDGIPDIVEAGGADSNNDGLVDGFTDTDNDGFSDQVDGDVGNDGTVENSAAALLRTGADPDNNGRANSYPYKNIDQDNVANPYDPDSDGDGISDVREAGFTDSNWNSQVDGAINGKGWNLVLASMPSLPILNSDGSGPADLYDIDSDNDGIPDNVEGLTTIGYLLPAGTDMDNDGIDDRYDNYNGFGGDGIHPVDTDGDSIPDYMDSDTDGDGLIDIIEGNDLNLNGMVDDLVTLTGLDMDGDGLDNRFDNNNSSAEATSAYMGNGGTTSGDPTPGSITTVQHTIVAYGCVSERDWRCIPYLLSCEFISFRATAQGDLVNLNWTVLCKQEVDYFILERSTDRRQFNQVGGRMNGRPILNEEENYTASDNLSGQAEPVFYYRLRSVMRSGRSVTSPVIAVHHAAKNHLNMRIIPNPVSEQLHIRIYSSIAAPAELVITDAAGVVLLRIHKALLKGENTVDCLLVYRFPAGIYFVKISAADFSIRSKFCKI